MENDPDKLVPYERKYFLNMSREEILKWAEGRFGLNSIGYFEIKNMKTKKMRSYVSSKFSDPELPIIKSEYITVRPSVQSSWPQIIDSALSNASKSNGYSLRFSYLVSLNNYIAYIHHDAWHQVIRDENGLDYSDIMLEGNGNICDGRIILRTKSDGPYWGSDWITIARPEVEKAIELEISKNLTKKARGRIK